MKPESLLDSVVFQLDESRSRCELWISAGESAERLASGYLTPFLSHLQTAQEQLANHCDCITLQCPSSSSQVASWFTKRTIERFVRFVSTPDVLERVSFLEAERVKLAEASSILISTESPHVSSPALLESDERDANGALTPEDDPESDSPRKSTASCARESDSKDECSGLEAREEMSSASVETSAIRRKGIVVIKKNLKFPQAGLVSGKQSDSESDRDSSENENRVAGDGRLSVQAAISLFETKQKKSKPSSSDVEKKVSDRSRTGGKQDSAAATSQAHAQVLDAPTREFQSGKQKLAAENANSQSGLPRCDRNIKANSSLESMKIDARSTQRIKNGQNEQVEQRMQPRLAKEGVRTTNSTAKTAEEIRKDLLSRTQQRTNAGNQATVKSADEISKELLDRSYNCLLKINSVVQDALFSASTLRQTKKLEEAKTDTEAADAESREWRSLANVSKLSLDDIFVEKRVSAKESSRRQSLCSPEEYGAGAVHGQIDQIPAPVASSDTQKGRFYEQYQEIRAAKYRKEPTHTKAERESKLRAMQDVLERRKTELLGRTTRLPEKNNTMTIEQLRAMKLQAMKNTVRKEPRSDSIKSLQSERLGARTRSSNILRSKQESSPCSTNSSSSTRKISPGLPKPAATPRNPARLSTSPGSKFSSPGAPGSHRRANFMSQSVISESLHTQAGLRKENARPLTGRNSLTGQPSRNYSRSDKVNRNLVLEASSPTSLRDNNSEKKRVGKDRTHQVLAPLRVPRDRSDDEKSRVKYDLPKNQGGSRIVTPRPKFAAAATKIEAPESKSEAGTTVSVVSSTPVPVTKSSDECIKQIVSCTSKDRNDHALESSNVLPPVEASEVPVIIKKSEMVTEMVSEMVSEVFKEEQKPDEHLYTPSKHAFVSSFDDDDMQIDEALEKCMSGRSFLDGISASPLTSFEPTTIAAAAATLAKTKEQLWNEQEHKIMSASLRSGPSSQSLPHLQRSISPTTVASFRNDFAAKEIKPLCKEHHQNKDQPKGLKRLLKFGRRSRGSDSNVADWNTINDDLVVQGSGKIRNEEHPRTGSSGVRRSLEALPKIADAASELSRNFFSSFRSKSSASDSARSRA